MARSTRPNILFFIMDDQRADTIHGLGNPDIATPTLDSLAEHGVYLRPYTAVPVCTPSRAEVLTGRHPFRNGCRWFDEPIRPDITLLPVALHDAGYHCCHIGKWHNDGHPAERGFHETHGVFPGCGRRGDVIGEYRGHEFAYWDNDVLVQGHSTEVLTATAIDFLQRAPQDQPWFCYIALHSPHDPRTAPAPWRDMYRGPLPPLPPNFMPEHPFDNGDMLIRDERLASFPRGHDEIRRHRADYYAMISHHDHYIGQVLHELRRLGSYDNTLIVFTSDHGLACGSHGLLGKENLYEHSVRVPLLLAGPNLPKGRRYDRDCLCGHLDLFPTLMDYLGLPPPRTCEGVSYLEVLLGSRKTIRETIGAAYRDCMRMATDGRYKLIYYPHIDRTQLFDLANDPYEINDLLTPWRRLPESRELTPALSPPQWTCIPDPNPQHNGKQVWFPLYEPALPTAEVDRVTARLRGSLLDWQKTRKIAEVQW